MQNNSQLAHSTLKTARYIFIGIAVQATLFALWGQEFFLSVDTPPTGGIAIYFVFGLMALASFAYGLRFFQNFTRIKSAELEKQPAKKRKESLLLITAIHFLLLEFVSVIGILLAIFVQKKFVIYPFFALFLAGFALSFPKPEWYAAFFKETP